MEVKEFYIKWVSDKFGEKYLDNDIYIEEYSRDHMTEFAKAYHKQKFKGEEICILPNFGIDKICFKCGKHTSEHDLNNKIL